MDIAAASFDVEGHVARLEADGYTVIEDFLDPATLREVREGLAPHLGHHSGRNGFEGYRTERVYTLVARGPVFARLTEDPRLLALLDRYLQPGYLLTASQAICIYPGEKAQPVHWDDSFYPIPRPRPPISLSVIAAVDEFTAVNGGTEIVPGSHRWSEADIARTRPRGTQEGQETPELEAMLRPMEMPAGACVVFLGTLLHRGGANRSDRPRLAFTNQYCQPWARTQENFYLGVPPPVARTLSPRLQDLLGYNIHPPFMGHVTASHPLKALAEDYVAPVLAEGSHSA